MKKFLAILLSVVMILSVGASSVVAFAKQVESKEDIETVIKPSVTVNGNTTSDVTIETDSSNPPVIIFTYTGDGDLVGWNFYDGNGNALVEGIDYTVVMNGNVATVTILNDTLVQIVADARVKGENNGPTKPTKPNKDNESPNTGAMGLTGLAVAGAGVAVLAAMKRKSDAE